MTKQINIISPRESWRDQFGFVRLVVDAMAKAGWEVREYGFSTPPQVNPLETLFLDAPSIVLRGGDMSNLAGLLDQLGGRKILWYAEDTMKDDGRELLGMMSYFSEIWLHWVRPDLLEGMKKKYGESKTIKEMHTLYADQAIWHPADLGPFRCEVLHYGFLTPRREKILGELRRKTGMVIYQVQDAWHLNLVKHINRAKVVLNLHAWSNDNIETRIAESLSAGAILISETLPARMEMKIDGADYFAAWEVPSGDTATMADLIKAIVRPNEQPAKGGWFADMGYVKARATLQGGLAEYSKRFNHLNIAGAIEEALG